MNRPRLRVNRHPNLKGSPFSEFRQAVRRVRPSQLLAALAADATSYGLPPYDAARMRIAGPWMHAVAARESILWGTEFRSDLTQRELVKIINSFNDIWEPGGEEVLSIMTRVTFEQFPYQESIFEEVSRTHALFVDGPAHIEAEVLTGAEVWEEVFPGTFHEVVGTTFFLHVGAMQNQGWWKPEWLDREDLQEIFDRWPRHVLEQRQRGLSATFDEFKADYAAAQPKVPEGWERYAYNPLTVTPFVELPDGRHIAPQPTLILRTITPGNLFYKGLSQWGEAFARDLGKLVEWYVGAQLTTISGLLDLRPEITYSKQNKKSIDWFLALPGLLVMFEVKSARFGLLAKSGHGVDDAIERLFSKAVRQLNTTNEQLDAQHPAFADIPSELPRLNIIVTAEPYYLSNSPWVRETLDLTTHTTLVASLRDLEQLVTYPAEELAAQLQAIAADQDRKTWVLTSALQPPTTQTRNRLLDAAWDAYPWPKFADEIGQADGLGGLQ